MPLLLLFCVYEIICYSCVMRGVARHIRVRGTPPAAAAGQLPAKTGESNSCASSTTFNSCEQRWRASGTRSSRLNSSPGSRDQLSFAGSRDLDSISWDSSVQLRHHVALVPNFYQTTPSIISFHHPPFANGRGNFYNIASSCKICLKYLTPILIRQFKDSSCLMSMFVISTNSYSLSMQVQNLPPQNQFIFSGLFYVQV
jgi:hypothetical protein